MRPGFDFDAGFKMFSIMFAIIFVLVVGIFLVMIICGVKKWSKNNHSPKLTVDATVVSKRIEVTHHHHANARNVAGVHGHHTYTSTLNYVTFQVESGDRMEFQLDGSEYGILAEGDQGRLTFQGTRYLYFERQ
jgi:hypothetical protein